MAIAHLKDVYLDQLEDIYSANTQSMKVTKELAEAAKDQGLKDALKAGVDGIEQGMAALKGIITAHGGDPKGEFCKGMEGLVKEARSHGIEEDISDPDARDAMIITQYQRMAHYAIAGLWLPRRLRQAPRPQGRRPEAAEVPRRDLWR